MFLNQVKSLRPRPNRIFALAAVLLLAVLCACSRKSMVHHDYMYVSAPETSLRDRVATMYNKVGTVKNGDRVEILEKQRKFLRVRTSDGHEGWVEERSLVTQDIYDGFQKLVQDNASTPIQAKGTTRAELNMHLTPARDADHLFQLKDGEKVDVLKRAHRFEESAEAGQSPRQRRRPSPARRRRRPARPPRRRRPRQRRPPRR